MALSALTCPGTLQGARPLGEAPSTTACPLLQVALLEGDCGLCFCYTTNLERQGDLGSPVPGNVALVRGRVFADGNGLR